MDSVIEEMALVLQSIGSLIPESSVGLDIPYNTEDRLLSIERRLKVLEEHLAAWSTEAQLVFLELEVMRNQMQEKGEEHIPSANKVEIIVKKGERTQEEILTAQNNKRQLQWINEFKKKIKNALGGYSTKKIS